MRSIKCRISLLEYNLGPGRSLFFVKKEPQIFTVTKPYLNGFLYICSSVFLNGTTTSNPVNNIIRLSGSTLVNENLCNNFAPLVGVFYSGEKYFVARILLYTDGYNISIYGSYLLRGA